MRQAIGDFLLRRLQEARIKHIFGVPGDYDAEADKSTGRLFFLDPGLSRV